MATPGAQFSLTLRIELPHESGTLEEVAAAITLLSRRRHTRARGDLAPVMEAAGVPGELCHPHAARWNARDRECHYCHRAPRGD